MSIFGTLAALDQGATIVMHEIDATAFGGGVYRFHDGLGQGVRELVWCGKTYTFWPVEVEEISIEGDKPTRPRLRIGNVQGYVTQLCSDHQDLLGAIYTLRTTKARYLDSANFEGWKGYALALEGQSKVSGQASASCTAFMLEVEAPRMPQQGKTAVALKFTGALPLEVVFRDGRLCIVVGAEVLDVASAPANAKFNVSAEITSQGGKALLKCFVNETPWVWQTQEAYAPVQALTIGGSSEENQSFRVRSLVMRNAPFTLPDIRAYEATGVVSNPVAHYRFHKGNVVDEISNVPLTVTDTAVTLQEDYYYALYGIGRQAVQRIDAIGNVYLVDWVKVNPTASIYDEFPAERFRLVRKASETPVEVSFELAPLWDVKGVKLPLKMVTENVCLHEYRDEYCGYSGVPRDSNGVEIIIPANATEAERKALLAKDDCPHNKKGCMDRFGRVLPIGSFLGAGRVKR